MLPYGARRVDGVMIPRWEDVRFAAGDLILGGGNDPFSTTWQPGGSGATYQVKAFAANDELFFVGQMPHGYVVGTDLRCHLHWTPRDRGTTESTKTVAWKVDCSFAPEDGVMPPSINCDLTDTCPNLDDVHLHTPDVEVDGATLLTPSGMIMGRVYRDTGDTWAGNIAAQAPALLEVDFHFLVDDVGSLMEHEKR